ncbi:MAG TPA: prepilin-type N-terminal cleavage/methylation domain-containing protein, partial [Candidatus Angelobacter sp.]|nr:prepilin-type N-terminal cleavage/methylation domain-containing protein [Candidatus Angelobacter sp.]
MNTKSKSRRTAGFSLLELLMVVFLLTIVVGALFSQIERAQVRYRVEDQKLDLTQQEREFIDQFTR